MMQVFYAPILVLISVIQQCDGISSPLAPYNNYTYSVELQPGLADLWWSINTAGTEITFEFHMKTTGWIALGISPAGGMQGADIGLGWIDQSGQLKFEDRFASGNIQPLRDNTTDDWFGLKGREVNGWTAIQFKRLIDTCDTMDVMIKSGTTNLIYAYANEDPLIRNGQAEISYHETRRYMKSMPLLTYSKPPSATKFTGLDYIEFKLNNYQIPTNDTTYHCQIFKIPNNITTRRHAISYEILIDRNNTDIVHHILIYECNRFLVLNDSNLPRGLCDNIQTVRAACSTNIANGWAVGGEQIVEYPEVAGYPMGGDFEVKYYMMEMHYDNPRRMAGKIDNSGVRYYLGQQLRRYELAYLTLGTSSNVLGISIPPGVGQFNIDSYCPTNATSRIPSTGITVISALPHTHLQGRSVWTKIVRNKTAIRYLFNAEAYDFNYQFVHIFPQPIQLFPGDELATRCVYNTANKNTVTIGGETTKQEMCLHFFLYYPRMNNLHFCWTHTPETVWGYIMNTTRNVTEMDVHRFVEQITWTNKTITDWQSFHGLSLKAYAYGSSTNYSSGFFYDAPTYEDMKTMPCKRTPIYSFGGSNTFSIVTLSTLWIFFFNIF